MPVAGTMTIELEDLSAENMIEFEDVEDDR